MVWRVGVNGKEVRLWRATLTAMSSPLRTRPASVLVAVAGAGLSGVAVVVLAVASLAAGHGTFSTGVAIFLLGYGALMLLAAWALWRLSILGRGPVVALSLINLITAWTFTSDAPWLWAAVVICAVTLVAAALPATAGALRSPVRPGGGRPRRDGRGT